MCKQILEERRQTEASGGRWGEHHDRFGLQGSLAWKYDPEVDIDNDGKKDAVVLLRRNPCGGENYKGVIEGSPTYAFVMSPDYRSVDAEKTSGVFGHPNPAWPKGLEQQKFRYIGDELGVFVFNGKTYFDTFLTSFTDFSDQRLPERTLKSTLGVFIHENGKTRQVCEFRWRQRLRSTLPRPLPAPSTASTPRSR